MILDCLNSVYSRTLAMSESALLLSYFITAPEIQISYARKQNKGFNIVSGLGVERTRVVGLRCGEVVARQVDYRREPRRPLSLAPPTGRARVLSVRCCEPYLGRTWQRRALQDRSAKL